MKLKVHENQRKPGEALSFYSQDDLSLPIFFDRSQRPPEIGSMVDVMITGVLYKRRDDGNIDYNRPKSMIARVPLDEDAPVEFFGFHQQEDGTILGSGRALLSSIKLVLTPGRTGVAVTSQGTSLIGVGWARRIAGKDAYRLEGVDDPKTLAAFRNLQKG